MKSTFKKSLMTGCAVTVLTLGLAACSSSSDDDNEMAVTTPTTPTEPTEPMGPTASDEQLTSAQTELAAALAALAGLGEDATAAERAVAYSRVAAATTAVEAAEALPENAAAAAAAAAKAAADLIDAAKMAVHAAVTSAAALTDASTGEQIAAAETALKNARDAIAAATGLSADEEAGLEVQATLITVAVAGVREGFDALATMASDLETARGAAMAAYTAAKTSDGEAAKSVENLATIQTGASSEDLAAMAAKYAEAAKVASDAAATEDDLRNAQDLQKKAEDAAVNAADYATKAETAAMAELMIDGTVKSVGDTTVNAAADASTVGSGTGANSKVEVTGLIAGVGPITPGVQTIGRAAVDETNNPMTEYKSPVANADMRQLTIGKTVDSDDDAARLRIVTKFASTQSVKVFTRVDNMPTEDLTAMKPGVITLTPAGDDQVPVDRPLTSLGLYYQAGAALMLETMNPDGQGVAMGATIATATTPVEVYSYKDADGDTDYAVLHGFETVAAETTYSYATADIFVAHNPDGAVVMDGMPQMTQVTALLPVARDYSHIHFGVWASLGDASSTGSQNLADLGIGFVQNIGDGLTADMPNNGMGTYAGNWVASVQGSHPTGEGNISEMSGAASLEANFRKGEVDGKLSDLASFKADIEDASFATDAVKVTAGDLDADDKWTGGLSGAFYGDEAIEAGGVFNFATKDNKGGAFIGAFGTARTDE